MDLKTFQEKYPDLYKAVYQEGHKAGYDVGFALGQEQGKEEGRAETTDKARADGAEAERKRIQAVESQAIPGHEALIDSLKYDGKTTGEQAAVKVLQAEKALRTDVSSKLNSDAPPAVPTVEPPMPAKVIDDKNLPVEERAKAQWDNNASIRKEFGDFAAFAAYFKAVDAGRVKILHKQDK